MKKSCFMLAVGLLFTSLCFTAFGQSYIPGPGVLSPDQVDFGGAAITFIGQIQETQFGEGTIREGRLEEAMELFNIGRIEFMYRPGADVIMARIMTGEATHDIIYEDWRTQYYAMAGHGMLVDLNEMLPEEYYNNLYETDRIIHQEVLSVGDHIYTFGNIYGNCWTPTAMVYNESMLEREGLPDIYDLWRADNWTWDQAEEMIIDVTRDLDGDGEIDQWGIAYRRLGYAIHINNAQFVNKDESGRYRYGFADENAVWVFNKIAEWYTNGYIVPKDQDGANRIGNGTVLMQFGSSNAEGGTAGNGDVLVYAPLPKGPHTDRYIYPEWAVRFAAIPVTAENPAGLVALFEFLFRQEDFDFDIWYAEQVTNRFPNQKSAQGLIYAINNWGGDIDWFNGFDALPDVSLRWGSDLEPLLLGTGSPRSQLEAFAPTVQAELDMLFKQ